MAKVSRFADVPMVKRIYLASPYSHAEAEIRRLRMLAACKSAAQIMRGGDLVFSPVAHSHPVAGFGLPPEWDYWRNWCLSFLENWATDFYILQIPGWKESIGVSAERQFAEAKKLPVTFWEAQPC